jgi:chemotaxis protein MotA
MAEPAEPKKAAPAKKTTPKSPGARPDFATLGGIAIAMAGTLGGLLLENGKIQDVAQATAAMIVMGGTFGAVLVTTPMPIVLRALAGLRFVFLDRAISVGDTIETLIRFATKARKSGIVSLEEEAQTMPDPFLRKALGLAVDGTDLNVLRKIMELDIHISEQDAEEEAKVWEAAGGYAPTIGIIGAVMGLIQVMKHLEDIKEVGHGIAVAFVATVYGVGSANIFFLPAANKLRSRMHRASRMMDLTLEGVLGIVEGLNPTLIRLKIESFNDEHKRPIKVAAKAKPKPGAAKQPAAPRPLQG